MQLTGDLGSGRSSKNLRSQNRIFQVPASTTSIPARAESKRQTENNNMPPHPSTTSLVPAISNNNQLPYCYFHKESKITKFCVAQECTLPLCEICENIHTAEHQKQNTQPRIRPYLQVREQALNELDDFIASQNKISDEYFSTLDQHQKQVQKVVKQYFESLKKDSERNLNMKRIGQLEDRFDKLKQGSIKSLIHHYSEKYQSIRLPRLYGTQTSSSLYAALQSYVSLEPVQAQRNSMNALSPPPQTPVNKPQGAVFFGPPPNAAGISKPFTATVGQTSPQYHRSQFQQATSFTNIASIPKQVVYGTPAHHHPAQVAINSQHGQFISPIQKLGATGIKATPHHQSGTFEESSQQSPQVRNNIAFLPPNEAMRPVSNPPGILTHGANQWRRVVDVNRQALGHVSPTHSQQQLPPRSNSISKFIDVQAVPSPPPPTPPPTMSNKVLSPEQIKQMLSRRTNQILQSKQDGSRNRSSDSLKRVDVVRHSYDNTESRNSVTISGTNNSVGVPAPVPPTTFDRNIHRPNLLQTQNQLFLGSTQIPAATSFKIEEIHSQKNSLPKPSTSTSFHDTYTITTTPPLQQTQNKISTPTNTFLSSLPPMPKFATYPTYQALVVNQSTKDPPITPSYLGLTSDQFGGLKPYAQSYEIKQTSNLAGKTTSFNIASSPAPSFQPFSTFDDMREALGITSNTTKYNSNTSEPNQSQPTDDFKIQNYATSTITQRAYDF